MLFFFFRFPDSARKWATEWSDYIPIHCIPHPWFLPQPLGHWHFHFNVAQELLKTTSQHKTFSKLLHKTLSRYNREPHFLVAAFFLGRRGEIHKQTPPQFSQLINSFNFSICASFSLPWLNCNYLCFLVISHYCYIITSYN